MLPALSGCTLARRALSRILINANMLKCLSGDICQVLCLNLACSNAQISCWTETENKGEAYRSKIRFNNFDGGNPSNSSWHILPKTTNNILFIKMAGDQSLYDFPFGPAWMSLHTPRQPTQWLLRCFSPGQQADQLTWMSPLPPSVVKPPTWSIRQ